MQRAAWLLAAACLVQAEAPAWMVPAGTVVGNATFCLLDNALDGKMLLPDAKCCNGAVIGASDPCAEDSAANAGLAFPGGIIAGDCVWKQSSVVVAARSTRDVELAVAFFTHVGIKFTTRCGGHSESCASTCHECATITTLHMKDTEMVTPTGSDHTYMVAQAGITVSDLVTAYTGTGYMIPHGGYSSICITGHFLGGGMGHMTRKYGFTSDHVVGVEIVLANGSAITVIDDEDEGALSAYGGSSDRMDKKLLRALKGSGHAGFGIVTKLYLRMISQPQLVVTGEMRFPMNSVADAHMLFNASCQYFGEAYDDTEETSRLQVWSRVFPIQDYSAGQPASVQFTITYIPDDVSSEAAALAEAMVEINKFIAPVTTTIQHNTLSVVTYDKKYEGSTGGSSLGLDGTCSSKVIMKKQDVCSKPEWLDSMAERIWEMVQLPNWLVVQELPYLAIEKWGGAGYYNDPHHEHGSMSTRDAWTAVEYCRWRLNPADPWTNIQEDVIEFNDAFLKPISHAYYKNYADYMVTDVRDLYPHPYIFHHVRLLKKAYDPNDVFSKDGGEPSLL
ncbi:6-hydroxy-D-nicotine oxidase [Diplonema papillatum]|nr:6-hydroxy-D-nicotine oxidase [Diplonema papillatum]|eukprot:gene16049-24576_t